MRATKGPGALAASGALEKDQLGSTVVSIPIASLHQLQALRVVVAWATHRKFILSSIALGSFSLRRAGHSSTPNGRVTRDLRFGCRLTPPVIQAFRPNSQQPTKERM